MKVTQERIKELIAYDENTGDFMWLNDWRNHIKRGDDVGTYRKGYKYAQVDGKKYPVHHLAWLYVFGYHPEMLDHINHDRADNRIINLREVTDLQNKRNRTKQVNNTSGVNGVFWNKNKNRWTAKIKVLSKSLHIGHFKKFSDAVDARKLAEIKYNFHENHGN